MCDYRILFSLPLSLSLSLSHLLQSKNTVLYAFCLLDPSDLSHPGGAKQGGGEEVCVCVGERREGTVATAASYSSSCILILFIWS